MVTAMSYRWNSIPASCLNKELMMRAFTKNLGEFLYRDGLMLIAATLFAGVYYEHFESLAV